MDQQTLIYNINHNSSDAKTIYRGSIFFFVIGILSAIFWFFGVLLGTVSTYTVICPVLFLLTGYFGNTIRSFSTGFLIFVVIHLIIGGFIFLSFLVAFIYCTLYVGNVDCSEDECSRTQSYLVELIIWSISVLVIYGALETLYFVLIRATLRYRKSFGLVS